MKRYLLVDLNSDYKEVKDYNELKDLLIETIQEDLLMNNENYDIVRDCSDQLIKMAKEKSTPEWVFERLNSYCYKVIDLLTLQRDLDDIKDYFLKDNKGYVGDICETIDRINREVNKYE